MNNIIESLRQELIRNADEKTKKSGERFFKEPVTLYGLKSAMVASIGKEYYKMLKESCKPYVFGLCEELWKSGMLEETFIACNWSYNIRKQYTPSDFVIFEKWINELYKQLGIV